MAGQQSYLDTEDMHPIDLAETIAQHNSWDFDRVGEDQIALAIEGAWRVYSVTIAWSDYDETLRMVCSFEMEPPEHRIPVLYETLNAVNEMGWTGAFAWWPEQKLMCWRHGLMLGDGGVMGAGQIDRLVAKAVSAAERFYPAFQLVLWADQTPQQALSVAMSDSYGRA